MDLQHHEPRSHIPIKSISSVQAKKDGIAYTKVTVFASGNTIDFRVLHAEAPKFKDAIMRLVVEPPATIPVPAAAGGLADELKKLADLRDAGVLSDAEFDAQKARLLG